MTIDNPYELIQNLKKCVANLSDDILSNKETPLSKSIDNMKEFSKILGYAAHSHKYIVDVLQSEFIKRWHAVFYMQPNTPKNWTGDEDRLITGMNLMFGLESYTFLKVGINFSFNINKVTKEIIITSPISLKAARIQISLNKLELEVKGVDFIDHNNTENRKSISFINGYHHRQEKNFENYIEDSTQKFIECFSKYILVKYDAMANEQLLDNIKSEFETVGKDLKIPAKVNLIDQKYLAQIKGLERVLELQEKEHLNYSLHKDLAINKQTKSISKI